MLLGTMRLGVRTHVTTLLRGSDIFAEPGHEPTWKTLHRFCRRSGGTTGTQFLLGRSVGVLFRLTVI